MDEFSGIAAWLQATGPYGIVAILGWAFWKVNQQKDAALRELYERVAETGKAQTEAMHALAFGQENRTLSECIDWAVDQARRMNEIDMQVEGDTDDEKSKSLVRAMLEAGLAERL